MSQFSGTTGGREGDHVTKHYNSFLLPNDITGDDEMKRAMMSNHRHSLLMINSETMDAAWAKRLWEHCEFKICADGGANRLYDGLVASGDVHKYIPDMIKGDLDSLRPDVKAFYSAAGTRIVYDLDQVTQTHAQLLTYIRSICRIFDNSYTVRVALTTRPLVISSTTLTSLILSPHHRTTTTSTSV